MSLLPGIRRRIALALAVAVMVLPALAIPGAGGARPTLAAPRADDGEAFARLALDVERTEDIRAVKALQITFAQYLQFGLWSEAASLFADTAEARYGADHLRGKDAIGKYFLSTWGRGRQGLPAGGIHTLMEDTPVLNLSADGRTAKGRWHEFLLEGQFGGSARWQQSVAENEYVKERGVWKVARLDSYVETAGPYETGWVATGPVEFVPFHYTPAEAGTPIPPIPPGTRLPTSSAAPEEALARLDRRIQSMNDEDTVANLQNAYGYYTDRKMWDDASDLFTDDGVLEIANLGIYAGARSIRRSYERLGPEGLQHGQLNDRPIFNVLVSVSPSGQTARTRSVTFNMLGDFGAGTASLGIDVLENRYLKGADGIWRIREMRVFPIMATDYFQGWAKSRLVTPPVSGPQAPDAPVPPADAGTLTEGAIPVFFLNHPVT
jgi:hypothetical protein